MRKIFNRIVGVFGKPFRECPKDLTRQGHALVEEGKYEEAEVFYNRALELEPDNPEYYNHLGHCFYLQENCTKAEPFFKKALAREPLNAAYINNLANSLSYQDGDAKAKAKAEKLYRKAVDLEPEDPDLRHNLGLCLYEQGKYEAAIPYFREAQVLDPQSALYAYTLSEVYQEYQIYQDHYTEDAWRYAQIAFQNAQKARASLDDEVFEQIKKNYDDLKKELGVEDELPPIDPDQYSVPERLPNDFDDPGPA